MAQVQPISIHEEFLALPAKMKDTPIVGTIADLVQMRTNVSHLLAAGKLPSQQLAATSAAGSSSTSRLFYIIDCTTGTCFLVDTGADVSVLPPSPADKRHLAPFTLQAVGCLPPVCIIQILAD